jgi:hypothetical protein
MRRPKPRPPHWFIGRSKNATPQRALNPLPWSALTAKEFSSVMCAYALITLLTPTDHSRGPPPLQVLTPPHSSNALTARTLSILSHDTKLLPTTLV